jgi:hypothetical protein
MRRAAKIAIGAGAAVMAVAVAVHVPLMLGHRGGCPFGFDKPAVAGPIHHDPRLRGNAVAGARPAFGFALGATTRDEVVGVVASNGGACKQVGPELECARALPGVETAWFTFGAGARLDSVRAVRRDPGAGVIGGAFTQIAHDLTARAGSPSAESGSADPADLARGALRQAAVEYRFTNYRAVVRATNLGRGGYALTEEYQNLVD